jgi:hypothetical protein
MSEHTPGPWRVDGRYVLGLKDKSVAELPQGGVRHGKVDEANAHLISAAPELLAALKRAYSDLVGFEGYFERLGSMGTVASLRQTLDQIDMAIEKARGEQP